MSMTDATFEKNTIELLKGIYDNINSGPEYKSITGVFTMLYSPPPFESAQTYIQIRSNNLDRHVYAFDATFTPDLYITIRVNTSSYSNGASGATPYLLNADDVDVILGSGYDTGTCGNFGILKYLDSVPIVDDSINIRINAKTPEVFGANSLVEETIGYVPFELRFYNLVPNV